MSNVAVPAGYERLDPTGVRRWLAARPALSARLGGVPDAWDIREVSDGNLNVVYVIKGPAGGVCVKQSLPYVRVAGASWPMPLERAYFEQLYVKTSEPYVGGLAPTLFHYDPERFAMAMELLAQHIILRRGLIAGVRYPTAARSVGEYVARRAFATSVLAEPFERVNARLAAFSGNHALLRITVDLIFMHPYVVNERNRWTTPQLDEVTQTLRLDAELKAAIARLGHRFLTVQEALASAGVYPWRPCVLIPWSTARRQKGKRPSSSSIVPFAGRSSPISPSGSRTATKRKTSPRKSSSAC